MSHRIGKTFSFAASHQLTHLPEGHKCRRLHGHNYTVTIEVEADQLDAEGFVTDYAHISDVMKPIIEEQLDHRHLNDLLDMPTAEILAEYLAGVLIAAGLNPSAVVVRETPTTFAEYRP